MDGSTVLGTVTLNPLENGTYASSYLQQVALTVPSLPAGTNSITAVYSGDQNFANGTSATLPVYVMAMTNPGTQNGAAGDNVSLQIQASSLPSGDTWTYSGTGLPSGLSINSSSGLVTGTITGTTNTYSVTVTSSASQGGSVSQNFTWNVSTLAVTNPGTQNSAVGGSVSLQVQASGLPSGDSWTYSATGLPSGLSVNTTSGLISGTVTAAPGAYAVSITAGDGHAAGASQNFTWNVGATTSTVTSSTSPSLYGQTVTFTATVTPVVSGSGTPTGTVTFLDGATVLGTGTLGGGVATFSSATLTIGGHSITAVYGGDSNFTSSTSNAVSQAVTQDSTSTGLVSSANPSVVGQAVTFTATVSAASPGSGTPGGAVTFMDGTTTLDTVTLSNGVATFTTSALAVGGHSITAVYSGDGNFTGSSSNVGQTVGQDGTSTSLTASPDPSVVGQAVTFTATVSASSPGAGTPTGTVTFQDGSTTLGTGTLSGGVATFSISTLAVGGHSITAAYGGDTDFTGSTSGAVGQTVNPDGTTTALVSSANPSAFGQGVTFTATVSANTSGSGTPGGTVTFLDGSTALGTGTLSGGVATFTTTALAVGSHSVTAVYGGDANHATSTSGALSQAVNPDGTTTALASSADPSASGQSVTFTATVSASSPGAGTPSGTVTFKDGSTTLGTGTLSGGKATFTTSGLAPGSHSITAVYGGDTNFTSSTSAAVNQSVAPTTTTLSSSLDPSVYGQSVTFTANVSPVIAGSGTPTGTVTFYDGSTRLGSAKLSGGKATFTTSALGAGSHSITAVYGGSSSFAASTSAAVVQAVNQDQTTTALSSSRNPARFGQTVTFTAVVHPVAPGAGTPTGTVLFYDGSTVLGSATLVGGKATFSISTLARGTHKITAMYEGDPNFLSSVSGVLNEVIQ
jgi:hypothetical protein